MNGAVGALEPAAEVGDESPEQGHQSQDHQEEQPVLVNREQGRANHGAELDHRREDDVLHANADGVDVGDGPADQAADPPGARLEVAHRHAQQVLVHPVAQVVDHRFTELQGETHPEVEVHLGGHGQDEKASRPQQGSGGVLPGDGTREHRAHHPAQRGQLDRPHDHQSEQQVAPAGERPGKRQQPADETGVEWSPLDLHLVRFGFARARWRRLAHASPPPAAA